MSELRATYRLQLRTDFGFADAAELIPYLRDLGISHLYLSPSLQARAGSTHGYDVVDPGRLSHALGGAEEFERLAEETRGAGMGIVLDVVPNHMAASDENRFWADPTLRERFFDLDPASGRWRRFFDVDDLAAVRQEDPTRCSRQTHELTLSLVSRWAGRRAAGRPSRRARRPRRIPGPPRARSAFGASGSRRSSTQTSGCATGR